MESKSLLLNLDPILANITIAQSIGAGFEALNAEMGTCGLKHRLSSAARQYAIENTQDTGRSANLVF